MGRPPQPSSALDETLDQEPIHPRAQPGRQRGWARTLARTIRRYHRAHGRVPNLLRPQRYTEKIQWRKLFDFNPVFTVLSDKVAAQAYVEARVGRDYRVPCLWIGEDPADIPFASLDPPYVLKSTHASGHTLVVQDRESLDPAAARREARSWLTYCHGTEADEPGYVNVPRRLIVEKLLVTDTGLPPLELKAFTFDGRVRYLLAVVVDPSDRSRLRAYFTPGWDRLPWSFAGEDKLEGPLPRPDRLADVLSLAERVAEGLDHVRVDVYVCDGRIYVGELTAYSQSGLYAVDPEIADLTLGRCWRIDQPLRSALRSVLSGGRVNSIRRKLAPRD